MKTYSTLVILLLLVLLGAGNYSYAQKSISGEYEMVGSYNPFGDLGSASVALTIADGGNGKYKAIMTSDESIPTHTIYRPQNLNAFDAENPLPIIVFGNGACFNSSQQLVVFLTEVASHGYIVIAPGPVKNVVFGMDPFESTTSQALLDAIDWAIEQNQNKESLFYKKMDENKIAAMGMSCGGMQAIEISKDPRIATTLVLNSGVFSLGFPGLPEGVNIEDVIGQNNEDSENKAAEGSASDEEEDDNPIASLKMGLPNAHIPELKSFHSPVLYVYGGKYDIATVNAEDNYQYIGDIPVFFASYDFSELVDKLSMERPGEDFSGYGHYPATYKDPHAGEFGEVAVAWLDWQFKGDKTAAKLFQGSPCGLQQKQKWTIKKKNID